MSMCNFLILWLVLKSVAVADLVSSDHIGLIVNIMAEQSAYWQWENRIDVLLVVPIGQKVSRSKGQSL